MSYRINFLKKASPKRNPFSYLGWSLLVVAGLELLPTVAQAADLEAVNVPTHGAVYRNPSARTLAPGAFSLGLQSSSATMSLDSKKFNPEDNTRETSAHLQRFDLGVGVGLGASLDLHINMTSATQSLDHASQKTLFGAPGSYSAGDAMAVSAMMKWQLVETGRLAIALAPFAESGVGSAGRDAIGRSRQPKAGWMSLLSYGEKGITTADVNFGYRYRSTEEVGDLRFRNEMFYGATATGYIKRQFGLFAGAHGRALQVSHNSEHVSGEKREYKTLHGSEIVGGVSVDLAQLNLAVYGGKSLTNNALGYGERSFGVKVSYLFGEDNRGSVVARHHDIRRDRRDQSGVIADLEGALNEDNERQNEANNKKPKKASDVEYDFFGNYDEEVKGYLESGAEKSDRYLIREELDQMAKDPQYQGMSEQELRDIELQKIEEGEAKRAQAEELARQKEIEKNRKSAAQMIEEEKRQYESLKKELQKELDELPDEFDVIDMNWE